MLSSIVIPGPKKPKDINSFLRPLVDELTTLENGHITATDGDTGEEFTLRAHVLMVTGDGPAAADAMGMKSPGNAFRPCRMCSITGVRRTDARYSPYYVPHTDYHFENPPIRTNLRANIETVEVANDDESRMLSGIKGKTELLRLRSIHFPRSFPGDIMHCVLQNITPSLFQLWNRTKLAIDNKNAASSTSHPERSGLPSYYLEKSDLDSIGDALVQSRATTCNRASCVTQRHLTDSRNRSQIRPLLREDILSGPAGTSSSVYYQHPLYPSLCRLDYRPWARLLFLAVSNGKILRHNQTYG